MEEKKFLKTINIAKREFEDDLIQLIQEANIPACILQDIFSKYLRELQDIAEADYKRDLEELKKANQKNDNNKNQQNENESNQN